MTVLQLVNLGTAPSGVDGDPVRTGFGRFNSNVGVLNTQTTLTSILVTTARALTAADMGKRIKVNLSSDGTLNWPAASTCGADQVVTIINVGTTIVSMAVTSGSGDTGAALSVLQPGDCVTYDTDGLHTWSALDNNRLSYAPVVSTIAALRKIGKTSASTVFVTGYYSAHDGGGGAYVCDSADTTSVDNGGTIIVAADGGRWKLQFTGRLSAKQFGCRGDATRAACGTGTDDTAVAQKYLTYCNSVGMTAWFPSGAYRFSSTLNISNSGQTNFPIGRASIAGDGAQNTVFQFDNGNYTGVSIVGSVTSIAATSMQTIRDLSVIKADGLGTGLFLQSHAHLSMSDVWCLGWTTGIDLEDVQESDFKNLDFQYNVIGLHAAKVTFTLPNVLTFEDCTFGNNKQGGLDLVDPTTLLFKGGSIESNNDLGGAAFTPIWGCRMTLQNTTTNEATQVATFVGTYFERNGSATVGKGLADVYLQNSVRDWGITLIGCNFNRGTTFATNQVGVSSSGGWRGKLTLLGNSFDAPALGGYPGPTASRPYWQIFGDISKVEVIDEGNYYQSSVEAPNYTGSVAMPASVQCAQSRIGGSVHFNGTTAAISSSFGVASVTRSSTGTYVITFANAQASTGKRNYTFSFGGAAGIGFFTAETTTTLTFQTVLPANTLADFGHVMVQWTADPSA